jgi:hypothetical protein
MMKIMPKRFFALILLVCAGLFSVHLQAMTTDTQTSSVNTNSDVTYQYRLFKFWKDKNTLVTSGGVYPIDFGVSVIDKLGTRGGDAAVTDGKRVNVRLKFVKEKLKQVVIY